MRATLLLATLLATTAPATAETWHELCQRRGDIRVGLNLEGIQKSCCGTRQPLKVNVTITAGHKHEQWVYRNSYLYLTDGIVTGLQQSR